MPRNLIFLLAKLSLINALVKNINGFQDYEFLVEQANIKLKNTDAFKSGILTCSDEPYVASMRKKRDDDVCNCGPLTTSCTMYEGRKICRCGFDRYVVDGDCKDCDCANAICHTSKGTCECLQGYGRNAAECIKCKCGANHDTCQFEQGIQFCYCNDYLALNSTCEECVCGSFEYCYYKDLLKVCNCTPHAADADERCKNCDCVKGGDACSFTEKTKMCKCIPGYSHLNGKCVECKCGKHYRCEFLNDVKQCICDKGYAEKNGTCEECNCGDDHRCKFDENDIVCICSGNYYFHNGTCIECSCDDGQTCEDIQGNVSCVCKKNHIEVDGICVECFCGDGHSCEIVNNKKICVCDENYIENNGTCEECHCGAGHACEFQDGQKTCKCLPNYADNGGICEECLCGENSTCFFESGVKLCICKEGFAEDNGMCHAACNQTSDCQNDGSCRQQGLFSFCRCKPGTSGDFCDKIDECHTTYKNCSNSFGNCRYNVKLEKTYCHCDLWQKYDSAAHICKECFCGEDHSCMFIKGQKTCNCTEHFIVRDGICHEICDEITCHRGKCTESDNTTFCSCDEGFTGQHCDQKLIITNEAIYLISASSAIILLGLTLIAVCIVRRKHRYKSQFSRIEDDASAIGSVPHEKETKM